MKATQIVWRSRAGTTFATWEVGAQVVKINAYDLSAQELHEMIHALNDLEATLILNSAELCKAGVQLPAAKEAA